MSRRLERLFWKLFGGPLDQIRDEFPYAVGCVCPLGHIWAGPFKHRRYCPIGKGGT